MTDESLQELHATVFGLRQVVAMLLVAMPKEENLISRLEDVEKKMRTQNVHSATLETIRSFRTHLEVARDAGYQA